MQTTITAQQDTATIPGAEPSVRWLLAGLSLSMLLASLGTSSANVALPSLAAAFGVSFQSVQWIVLAYLLGITTLIVSVGRLGDMIGRKRLLLAGLVLITGASVACGIAPVFWLLVAARALQGLGAAILMALTMAFVAETVPKAMTGRAMGLLGAMSAAGTALGPSLGGVLVAALGWQAIFLVNVPLGVVTYVLLSHRLPTYRQAPVADRPGFDIIGTTLLALSVGAYALAMTIGRGGFGWLNASLLAGAAAGLGLFILHAARTPSPLIRLSLFRDPSLTASVIMSALVSTVIMATLVVGPFYLAYSLRLNAALVGIVLSAGPLVAALTGVPAGHLTDRFGAHRMTLAGLAGMTTGSLALSLAPASAGVLGYVAPIAVVTASYALFQTANNTAVMKNVPPERRGVISGVLNLSRNLGLITGASAMGAVFAVASGTSDIAAASPKAISTAMSVTFAVATGIIVMAAATAHVGRRLLERNCAKH